VQNSAFGADEKQVTCGVNFGVEIGALGDGIRLPVKVIGGGEKEVAVLIERMETLGADDSAEVDIADLWLPFFCVSSNLTTGAYHLHRMGVLRTALRATIALPGVMPPAIDGNDVLVDGAIMKNFPTDVMRSMHLGPVVGVDVTRGRSISADDVARPSSVWRWILSGEWRKGPPIVALLMRTATVSTGREITASRQATDLLILPNVEGVDLRDWKAYDPTIAMGHKAAIASLDALRRQDLRDGLRAKAERLAEVAMTDLVTRGEVGHVMSLVRHYGTAIIGSEGFINTYVRAMRAFDDARALHASRRPAATNSPTDDAETVNAYRLAAELFHGDRGLRNRAIATQHGISRDAFVPHPQGQQRRLTQGDLQ
jgi:hypothetical protein